MNCIGAVVYPGGEACAQVVRTSYASHAAKVLNGRLSGQPLCGYPDDENYPAPSGSAV